jgi:hypothetical protein
MNIEGFAIDLERCRDGVELVEQRGRKVFRYRSERIDRLRHTFVDLEKTVLIDFVNAVDDRRLQAFFERFGLMQEVDRGGRLLQAHKKTRKAPIVTDRPGHRAIDREDVLTDQLWFRELLKGIVGDGNQFEAIQGINSIYEQSNLYDLTPSFHLAGPGGTPKIVMESRTFIGFMILEAAMIATHGARAHVCKHCWSFFLTGPTTWRRSHAVYCSDKCRVAAMRARKATG